VSSFGVGYDNIDVKYAAEHGIVVANTPEVLNEEVADTALGLLLCTVREFPKAERFLRKETRRPDRRRPRARQAQRREAPLPSRPRQASRRSRGWSHPRPRPI